MSFWKDPENKPVHLGCNLNVQTYRSISVVVSEETKSGSRHFPQAEDSFNTDVRSRIEQIKYLAMKQEFNKHTNIDRETKGKIFYQCFVEFQVYRNKWKTLEFA